MKKKNVLIVIVLLIVATLAQITKHKSKIDDLCKENVQALSRTEFDYTENGKMKIHCDEYSKVILCQKGCACGILWGNPTGHGNATLSGKCICGVNY